MSEWVERINIGGGSVILHSLKLVIGHKPNTAS